MIFLGQDKEWFSDYASENELTKFTIAIYKVNDKISRISLLTLYDKTNYY